MISSLEQVRRAQRDFDTNPGETEYLTSKHGGHRAARIGTEEGRCQSMTSFKDDLIRFSQTLFNAMN